MKAKRSWRKLHLAIDEKHQIIDSALTEKKVGDNTTALPALLEQMDDFKIFMVDGAYDSHKVYEQVLQKNRRQTFSYLHRKIQHLMPVSMRLEISMMILLMSKVEWLGKIR